MHLLVDLLAQPADLALGDAAHAHRLDQIVDRAGRDALDVGLLDHRGQRLLGHAPRLQEAGEVAALAQLGDAQLDRPGARLPGRGRGSRCAGRAVRGSSRHRPAPVSAPTSSSISRSAAKPIISRNNIGVGGLLHERAKAHHLVGHRRFLGLRWSVATRSYRRIADDHRKPLVSVIRRPRIS